MSYSKFKKIKINSYDRKWSILVRARDEMCLKCGKTEYLNAHHFVRRSVKSTRLMLENGITLCASCHTFNNDFSAHRTPKDFKQWFMDKYPKRAHLVLLKEKIYMTEKQSTDEFKKLTEKQDEEM